MYHLTKFAALATMLLLLALIFVCSTAAVAASPTPFVPPSTTPVPLPSDCPAGARVFTPTKACYWIIKEQKTWSEADLACSRKGGKLASVEAEDENEFLYDFTRSVNFSSPTFWLSKLDKKNSGQYEWHDGITPRNTGAFKNFITREAGTVTELCVSMWSDYTQADGSWHPWSCNFQGYSGVCKRKYRNQIGSDLRSTISPLEDSIQANRCCTHCGKACASNERCIPDDLDCLVKTCPGADGYGWCLPTKVKN